MRANTCRGDFWQLLRYAARVIQLGGAMAERLRAVVIGPGFIGMVHADALRRNGVEIAAFVGSGSQVGREKADAFGVPYFDSLAAALAAEQFDAVHITTPNALHAPL